MSNFLLLSEGGDSVGLGMRLLREGHDVRMWIREEGAAHYGEGLVDRAEDLDFGAVVIADCTGLGALCDSLRESGRLVYGGSLFHDKLESDRQFSRKVFKSHGIPTPNSKYLKGPKAWDDATEIVAEYDGETKLVFKPGGACSGVIPSYVPHDNEDLLQMLEFYRCKIGEIEPEFELQEFHEGVCISTEGWFDGEKFARPFNHTLETKALMPGNIGPSGGCTGNLVWAEGDDSSPTVQYLLRLAPFLAENGYMGPIDLNCVIGEDGIWALEFTPRFGYDAFPTFLYSLFDGDFGAFVSETVRGYAPETMLVRGGYGSGIRLTIPPWPNEQHEAPAGIPIRGFSSRDMDMLYLYDVRLKGEDLVTSGGYGVIGVANGWGESIEAAFDDAYRITRHAKIPDLQFRNDMTETFQKDYRRVGRILSDVHA